jgi:hypothetical protein
VGVTYECWTCTIEVCRKSLVPVLGNSLLAWKPDVTIVRAAHTKKGLQDVAVKICLDIFRRVLE